MFINITTNYVFIFVRVKLSTPAYVDWFTLNFLETRMQLINISKQAVHRNGDSWATSGANQ